MTKSPLSRPFIFTCSVGHKHRFESAAKNCHYCKRTGVAIGSPNKPGDSVHFRSIRGKHKEEIKPVMNNIRRDWDSIQGKVFEGEAEVTSRAGVKMGNFYETMTACLFGGRLIKSPAEIGARAKGNDRDVVPDVVCDERQHIIESKACQQRSHLNLYDTQVNGYLAASKIKGYRTRFAIWRHGFQGIHKYKGSLIDLYTGMADATYAGLVIPLRLIIMLWKNPSFKRYETRAIVGPLTALSSKFLNSLINKPQEALYKIGVDHREFEFSRLLSPKGLMIENVTVPQFPVMIISNVVSDPWVDDKIPF